LTALWIGRPGPRFRADRNGRGPAPVAIDGRLFVLGDGRVLGMDSYTGTVLWTLSIPSVTKYNIPRDCGNWCADEKRLYIPLGGECLVLNAKTGNVEKFLEMPGVTKDKEDWSYIARSNGSLFGGSMKKGSKYTSFWGGQMWYDARSDAVRSLVCSDTLFALNPANGAESWKYLPKGLMINPTITIGDGEIYFLESKNAKLRSEKRYRFTGEKLFAKTDIVALNAKTGKELWRRAFVVNDDFKFPIEVLYLAYGNGALAVVASRFDKKPNGTFFLTVLNAEDGSERYKKSFAWIRGNHGWHMSRPLIVGDRLVVRPKVFSLKTGKELATNVFNGHCGSYVAVENAIITRHGSITLWRLEDGKWSQSGWNYLRPGCWISMVPADGLFLVPEGGGGCKCGMWFETSIAFAPRQ
jgi:outer membrane protein assembly factor BamB